MADGDYHTLKCHVFSNVGEDEIKANVLANLARPLRRLGLRKACLVGGGPSVVDHVETIRERKLDGWDIISLNATHDWLIGLGIYPDYHVTYDARPHMADMVRDWRKDCEYLVGSRCHRSVFDALGGANVTMFHTLSFEGLLETFREHAPDDMVLESLSTVGLTAINLAIVMGYRQLELYGYDSSWRESHRHAYGQAVNASEEAAVIQFNGIDYETSLPMAAQAQAFRALFGRWTSLGTQIVVVGDGLLPAIWLDLTRVRTVDEAAAQVEQAGLKVTRD